MIQRLNLCRTGFVCLSPLLELDKDVIYEYIDIIIELFSAATVFAKVQHFTASPEVLTNCFRIRKVYTGNFNLELINF